MIEFRLGELGLDRLAVGSLLQFRIFIRSRSSLACLLGRFSRDATNLSTIDDDKAA